MQDRRTVLGFAAAGAMVSVAPGFASVAAFPPPVPAPRRFHLVNGWVLTDADLRRLGLDRPGVGGIRLDDL